MRVRVGLIRLAMRRPPGVPDADGGPDPLADLVPQVLDPPGGLGDLELAPVHDRQARGVIPPVLQPAQSLDQYGHGLPAADVAHDSAHECVPSPGNVPWSAVHDPAQLT